MVNSILLTGATGFLGSNLLGRLKQESINVIVLKRSFSNTFRIGNSLKDLKFYDIDKTDLEVVFKENKIDIIIHCATNYGRKDSNPLEIIDANLILPLKLLQFGIRNNITYFINTDTYLDKRINNYSLSKKHFQDWLRNYSEKIRSINVMIEHFYGYNDDNTKFVTMIIEKILKNEKEINLTKGEQKRDFIYIDDVISAFMTIIDNIDLVKKNYIEYEIGTGRSISIREVCESIKMLADNKTTKLNFGVIPYRQNEVMESFVDISKLNLLGWNPKFNLYDGLRETIEKERKKIK